MGNGWSMEQRRHTCLLTTPSYMDAVCSAPQIIRIVMSKITDHYTNIMIMKKLKILQSFLYLNFYKLLNKPRFYLFIYKY